VIERFPKTLSPWYLRLFLAVLFLFGAEVLLWVNPLHRAPSEWLLLVSGYIALAALVLDLATRYRIRDVYDVMTLLAIYGLLVGLLLYPRTGLAEVPDTIINRVLGGQSLIGLEMFGLLLALTGGHNQRYRRLMLPASLWLGFYWGVWGRWSSVFNPTLYPQATPIETMLLIVGVSIAVILGLFALTTRRIKHLTPPDWRLSVIEWGAVSVTLLLLFLIRASQNVISDGALVLVLVLIIVCLGTLWFRRQERGQMLLDAHLPPTSLDGRWLTLALLIFVGSGVLAYHLPLVELFGLNQYSLMTLGFALVGLVWLPLIAAVRSVQALDRQSRTGKL
jgi:hypothetical protein